MNYTEPNETDDYAEYRRNAKRVRWTAIGETAGGLMVGLAFFGALVLIGAIFVLRDRACADACMPDDHDWLGRGRSITTCVCVADDGSLRKPRSSSLGPVGDDDA